MKHYLCTSLERCLLVVLAKAALHDALEQEEEQRRFRKHDGDEEKGLS